MGDTNAGSRAGVEVEHDPVVTLAERMLHLVWTISRSCARSRGAAARVTYRVLTSVDWVTAAREPDGRRLRAELISNLARRWSRRTPRQFRAAASQAVLQDEYALLPQDQRRLLAGLLVERPDLTELANEIEIPRFQAALMAGRALLTMTTALRAH